MNELIKRIKDRQKAIENNFVVTEDFRDGHYNALEWVIIEMDDYLQWHNEVKTRKMHEDI